MEGEGFKRAPPAKRKDTHTHATAAAHLRAHGERLFLAKVKVLGLKVHELGLGEAAGGGARAREAVKRDEALAADVEDLARGGGVAEARDKRVGEVGDVAELRHLFGFFWGGRG